MEIRRPQQRLQKITLFFLKTKNANVKRYSHLQIDTVTNHRHAVFMYEQKTKKKNLVKLLHLSRVDLFVLTIGSIQQLFRHPSLLPIEVFTATQKHKNKERGRPGRQKQQSVNH